VGAVVQNESLQAVDTDEENVLDFVLGIPNVPYSVSENLEVKYKKNTHVRLN
jgi:hypothetical protein